MKFWQAMMEMQESGKRVRYTGWVKNVFIDSYSDFAENFGLGTFDSTIKMLNGDWEIYEEPPKQYTFSEITPLLKEGKKFKRKDWENKLIFQSNDHIYIYNIIINNSWAWVVKVSDIESGDWIEVKE